MGSVGGFDLGGAAPTRHGDFHGPWPELDPNCKFGEYLRKEIGGPPEGMERPHAHHGVFKQGQPGVQSEMVAASQDILRSRC